MARFKSKTQLTYEAVLDDPSATPGEKLKAAELLEQYKTQRKHYRRHTKAKAILGLGAKDRIKDANHPLLPRMPSCVDHLSPERRKAFIEVLEAEQKAELSADDFRRMELGKNPTPENLAELTALMRRQAAKNGVAGASKN